MSKTALITGVNGQDGSYLAEFLLSKNYKVIGLHRRSSTNNLGRLKGIKDKVVLVEGDVCDYASLSSLIGEYKPNEIYNLAAQSHVHTSFNQPFYTTEVDYIGCLNLLEIIRRIRYESDFLLADDCTPKLYQASTSEMFGSSVTYNLDRFLDKDFYEGPDSYQDEDTPMKPNSPYAIAKLAAHNAIRLYREAYGLFCCSGILFNHESPRRGDEFVTKKITNYLKEFKKWINEHSCWEVLNEREREEEMRYYPKLKLGNLDASRDWGYAEDYVEGMWLMLQQEKSDDFVLATGETHTIREFLEEAFYIVGNRQNIPRFEWGNFVSVDEKLKRPSEVPYLCGNASKAKEKLGWGSKTTFRGLVKIMVENDS